MLPALLFLHSLFRWLLLVILLVALVRAYRGWLGKRSFAKFDNTLRHSTATIAQIQLTLGFTLYAYSPLSTHFFTHFRESLASLNLTFFGLIHPLLMLAAVVLISLGSAFSKRKMGDEAKFKTMALWFSVALLLIFVAIPWPFSPLAERAYFRAF